MTCCARLRNNTTSARLLADHRKRIFFVTFMNIFDATRQAAIEKYRQSRSIAEKQRLRRSFNVVDVENALSICVADNCSQKPRVWCRFLIYLFFSHKKKNTTLYTTTDQRDENRSKTVGWNEKGVCVCACASIHKSRLSNVSFDYILRHSGWLLLLCVRDNRYTLWSRNFWYL